MCKDIFKKIKSLFIKKTGIHYGIYGTGLFISIVLIGLYFINKDNAWCIVSCSVGASLIGAIVLGFALDCRNSHNKTEQSKRIFQIAHTQLYFKINSLMMVLNLFVREFYQIIDKETVKYENLTIAELIQKYVDIIKEVKVFIAPVISNNEIISTEELDLHRKQNKVKELLKEYNNSIIEFREQFNELWKNAKQQQNLLLINDSTYEKDISQAIALLNILSYQRNDICKESELIELGNSLQEIINCKVIDVLERIGFENIRFNNLKGFMDIKQTKEKN
ncbi:MAG: hypothetical protein IJA15_05395 [Clostridia bacterium]|nr:hypothetical protein [Clostridia bacterium]